MVAPQAILVRGDIIQGIPLLNDHYTTKIEEQYGVAIQFLDELVRRFLGGDRSRLIMVSGNHDVDWNTAFNALVSIPNDELSDDPEIVVLPFSVG